MYLIYKSRNKLVLEFYVISGAPLGSGVQLRHGKTTVVHQVLFNKVQTRFFSVELKKINMSISKFSRNSYHEIIAYVILAMWCFRFIRCCRACQKFRWRLLCKGGGMEPEKRLWNLFKQDRRVPYRYTTITSTPCVLSWPAWTDRQREKLSHLASPNPRTKDGFSPWVTSTV